MTREEKCKLAIERGYTYDSETGIVYNRYGKITKYTRKGYICLSLEINEKTQLLSAHQFAWYWVNKECVEEIDHVNGIRDDNRIVNLRAVTRQQNQWNRTNAKGYTWWKRDNNWRAQIKINSKTIFLGHFKTEQEARNAYLAAKEIYHKI